MSSRSRGQLIIVLILVAVAALLFLSQRGQDTKLEPFSEVVSQIRAGNVQKIQVEGDVLLVELEEGGRLKSQKEHEGTLSEQLVAFGVTQEQVSGIEVEVVSPVDWWSILSGGGSVLLLLLMLVGGYLMLRQFQGANNQAMAFGKSRARMYTGDQPSVTFEDVAGVEEAKEG